MGKFQKRKRLIHGTAKDGGEKKEVGAKTQI